MGFLKKIKDIFYDEEIIEVPIKEEKTAKKLEIEESPKIEFIQEEPKREERREERREEIRVDSFSERELFKSEKTFDFPVIDDDEVPMTRSKTNILEIQKELERGTRENREVKENKKVYSSKLETRKPSTFKPSPVISPIYGVLDKNYTKDGIIERKEEKRERTYESKSSPNYDYIRAKAYGSLEDELENTLTRVNNNDIKEEVEEIEKEISSLSRPSRNIEELLSEIQENKTISIGDMEEKAKDKMLLDELEESSYEIPEKVNNKEVDNSLEHDLFNLIDSMYDDKEE